MSFEPNLFYDFTLQNLAEFLKEGLNERGIAFMEKYAERFPHGFPAIVRSLYYAEQPNISIIENPSLCVYRLSCDSFRYKGGNGVRTCQVVIQYTLDYPNLESLPNILNWVDFHVHQLLLNYEYEEFVAGKPIQEDLRFIPDRTEYRTQVNVMTTESYPYLRWLIRLRDDACPTPRNKDQFNFDNCY